MGLHDKSIGFAEESTWGTPVTASMRHLPLVREGLTMDRDFVDSDAIISGRRRMTSDEWELGNKTVGGPVEMELYDRQIGLLLKHIYGSVATTGSSPYTHTFTDGSLSGLGLTVQVLKPFHIAAGTVEGFTYHGCKIPEAEIVFEQGKFAKLALDLVGEDEDTTTTDVTASYASGITRFLGTTMVCSLNGSSVKVRKGKIKKTTPLDDGRRNTGSALIDEPLEMGGAKRLTVVELELEFAALTEYDRYRNGTEAAYSIQFVAGSNTLTFAGNGRSKVKTPNIEGKDNLIQTIEVTAIASGADSTADTCTLVNTESSP